MRYEIMICCCCSCGRSGSQRRTERKESEGGSGFSQSDGFYVEGAKGLCANGPERRGGERKVNRKGKIRDVVELDEMRSFGGNLIDSEVLANRFTSVCLILFPLNLRKF